MLELLFFLGGWVEAWSASGTESPSMGFVLGPEDRPKRAAWATIEGSEAMGQITIWASGECEIEAYSLDGSPLVNESLVVSDPEQLASAIRRVLVFCS